MLCIAWLGGKAADSRKAILVIITLTSTSLFSGSIATHNMMTGLVFFRRLWNGSNSLWATQRGHSTVWFMANVLLATLALFIDFRLRILIAVLVALIVFSTEPRAN